MPTYDHRLAQLARGHLSAARIHKVLLAEGHVVSLATCGRKLAALRAARKTPPAPAAPRKTSTAPLTNNASALARLCARYPSIETAMRSGSSKLDAIIDVDDLGDELAALESSTDLADVARYIVDDFGFGWQADPGQSVESFAEDMRTMGEAELARTIALLEGAIEIVRARGVSDLWAAAVSS